MTSGARWVLLLLVGVGLAVALGFAAQQREGPSESELERVARRAWDDLQEGQSESYIASAVQTRVERSLPPADDPAARRSALLEALGSLRPSVQWTALVSLHLYGPADTPLIARLIELAREPVPRIRKAAGTAIGSTREVDDEGAALLRDVLDDRLAVLRSNALRVLARARGGLALLPTLIGALTDADPTVRHAAAYGIALIDMEAKPGGTYPFAHVVAPLRAAMSDADTRVRVYAAMALGRMGPHAAPAVGELIGCLEGEHSDVRSAATMSLGSIGPPAVEPLEAFVRNSRSGAGFGFWALMMVGDEAVPALRRLLADDDAVVRVTAARTLWDLEKDRDEMIAVMARHVTVDGATLDDRWESGAMQAIEGLARAGKAARPAAEALKAVAEHADVDELVREMARDALLAIGDE